MSDDRHTWVILIPTTTHIPSFENVAHTEIWISAFLLLANQNRYGNEVLNMRIWWRQTTWVVLVSTTTHIPSFTKIGQCVHARVYFLVDEQPIHPDSVTTKIKTVGSTSAPHYPHTKFRQYSPYRTLDICIFVISQSEQIWKRGNMSIWCTSAHHYPHTKFCHCSPCTELWIFAFFVICQSEQICNWGIKYAHSVMTDHMGSTCVHHYPHTKFYENRSMRSR